MNAEIPARGEPQAAGGVRPPTAPQDILASFVDKNQELAHHLLVGLAVPAAPDEVIEELSTELWRWVKHRAWQIPDQPDRVERFLAKIAHQVVVTHFGPDSPVSRKILAEDTDSADLTQLALALSARSGDPIAFAALWERNYVRLLGFVRINCSRATQLSPAEEYLNWLYEFLAKDVRNFDPARSEVLGFIRDRAKRSQGKFVQESRGRELQFGNSSAPDQSLEASALPELTPDTGDRTVEAVVSRDLLSKALRVLFDVASPPHQILTFAFKRVLGRDNPEIIKLWHWRLRAGAALLETTRYRLRTGDFRVGEAMGPLQNRLAQPLDLVFIHPKTRKTYASLLGDDKLADKSCGAFRFVDFGSCHDDTPAAVIDNWIENAEKQFRKKFRNAYGDLATTRHTDTEEAAR